MSILTLPTLDQSYVPTGETADHSAHLAVLDDIDLNHVVIEDVWGADSVDWLVTQHALDATPASEIAYRRALAGLAPICALPTQRRRAIDEQRAA